MKGKLINKQGEWFVRYIPEYIHNPGDEIFNCEPDKKELPLHPDTNPFGWSYAGGEEIEFEIVDCNTNCSWCNNEDCMNKHAKLIQPKSKEQIIEEYLINNTKNFGNVKQSKEETWKDVLIAHSAYRVEEMNAGRQPISLDKWLDIYYTSPIKKK